MAELDYAFIADYAAIQGAKLTAIGASYAYLITPTVPHPHLLYVAGRVRAPEGVTNVPFSISVGPADGDFMVTFEGALTPDASDRAYDGKVGLLFAAAAMLQLPSFGLYEVKISLDGTQVRRLAFEVVQSTPPT